MTTGFKKTLMEILDGSPKHAASHYVEWAITLVVLVNCSAVILDSAYGIQVRAGLHCSPHALSGGPQAESIPTLRVSPGWQTTPEQIKKAAAAIREIAS
jgi:hypothetical protein